MRVAIVGSGFAGSILARVARVAGHEVTLVERDAHPRFALGESSTPLAAIALERIAARYGLDDLHDLAAYGRWSVRLPDVRRGLKRGFTFYRHCPGEPFRNDEFNVNRLLVAASPDDAVADAHWLREDVDAFLARRAEAEGVRYLDRTLLDDLETRNGGLRLAGTRAGKRIRLTADLVVDASGAGGFLARHLDIAPAVPRGARCARDWSTATSPASRPCGWRTRTRPAFRPGRIPTSGRPYIICSTRAGCTSSPSTTGS